MGNVSTERLAGDQRHRPCGAELGDSGASPPRSVCPRKMTARSFPRDHDMLDRSSALQGKGYASRQSQIAPLSPAASMAMIGAVAVVNVWGTRKSADLHGTGHDRQL
jgi:hypothetical protein